MVWDIDNRDYGRVIMVLPVRITAQGPSGTFIEDTVTEELSTAGAYFQIEGDLEMNVRVNISISIPDRFKKFFPNGEFSSPAVVTRLEKGSGGAPGKKRVAVRFKEAFPVGTLLGGH